jgi:hypothetical protein
VCYCCRYKRLEQQSQEDNRSKAKIIALYKDGEDERNKKLHQQTKAVADMAEKYEKEQQANQAEKEMLTTEKEAAVKENAELKEKVTDLNKRLQKADELNDLLSTKTDQVNADQAFPTASATSKYLKGGDVTLTKVYTQLVETTDELETERAKTQRLESHVFEIINEVQANVPVLRRYKASFLQAREENERLLKLNEQNSREIRQLTGDLEIANQAVAVRVREANELEWQLRSLRNMTARTYEDSCNAPVPETPEELIELEYTFIKGSEDSMPDKYIQMLTALHKLTAERVIEGTELATKSKELTEVTEQLHQLREEVLELDKGREEHIFSLQTIVKQREAFKMQRDQFEVFYRNLCEKYGENAAPTTNAIMASPTSAERQSIQGEGGQQVSLNQLQQQIAAREAEHAANDAVVQKRTEGLERERDALSRKNIDLDADVNRMREMCATYERKFLEQVKVAEAQRKLKVDFSQVSKQREQEVEKLRSLGLEMKATIFRLEHEVESTKRMQEIDRGELSRLQHSYDAVQKDSDSKGGLLTNIRSLLNEMKLNQFDAKTRFEKDVESLQRQRDELRKRADQATERARVDKAALEEKIDELHERAKQDLVTHQKTREDLLTATLKLQTLEFREVDLQGQLKTLSVQLEEAKTTAATASEANAAASSLESPDLGQESLATLQAEVTVLKQKIVAADKRAVNYREISEASAKELDGFNRSSAEYRRATELELKRGAQDLAELQAELSALRTDKAALTDKGAMLESEVADTKAAKAAACAELEEALAEAKAAQTKAELRQAEAETNAKKHAETAADNVEKYQNELKLRASDVEEAQVAKARVHELTAATAQLEASEKLAKAALKQAKASWEAEQAKLVEQANKAHSEVTDLQKQCERLHKHLEAARQEVLEATRATAPDAGASDLSSAQQLLSPSKAGAEAKTIEEVWELERYQHRRAQIAEAHLEEVKLDVKRRDQQLERLNADVSVARKQLAEERERSQAHAMTAEKHNDLLAQLEQMEDYKGRIRIYRDDKEKAEKELAGQTAQICELEKAAADVRQETRVLQGTVAKYAAERDAAKKERQHWETLAKERMLRGPEDLKKVRQELAAAKEKYESELKLAMEKAAKAQAAAVATQQAEGESKMQKLAAELAEKVKEIAELNKSKDKFAKAAKHWNAKTKEKLSELKELSALVDQEKKSNDLLKRENEEAVQKAASQELVATTNVEADAQSAAQSAAQVEVLQSAKSSLESELAAARKSIEGLKQEATAKGNAMKRQNEKLQAKSKKQMDRLREWAELINGLRREYRLCCEKLGTEPKQELVKKLQGKGDSGTAGSREADAKAIAVQPSEKAAQPKVVLPQSVAQPSTAAQSIKVTPARAPQPIAAQPKELKRSREDEEDLSKLPNAPVASQVKKSRQSEQQANKPAAESNLATEPSATVPSSTPTPAAITATASGSTDNDAAPNSAEVEAPPGQGANSDAVAMDVGTNEPSTQRPVETPTEYSSTASATADVATPPTAIGSTNSVDSVRAVPEQAVAESQQASDPIAAVVGDVEAVSGDVSARNLDVGATEVGGSAEMGGSAEEGGLAEAGGAAEEERSALVPGSRGPGGLDLNLTLGQLGTVGANPTGSELASASLMLASPMFGSEVPSTPVFLPGNNTLLPSGPSSDWNVVPSTQTQHPLAVSQTVSPPPIVEQSRDPSWDDVPDTPVVAVVAPPPASDGSTEMTAAEIVPSTDNGDLGEHDVPDLPSPAAVVMPTDEPTADEGTSIDNVGADITAAGALDDTAADSKAAGSGRKTAFTKVVFGAGGAVNAGAVTSVEGDAGAGAGADSVDVDVDGDHLEAAEPVTAAASASGGGGAGVSGGLKRSAESIQQQNSKPKKQRTLSKSQQATAEGLKTSRGGRGGRGSRGRGGRSGRGGRGVKKQAPPKKP